MGCCSEGYHKHQDTFRLPDDLKVGRCWWTMDRTSYQGAPNNLDENDSVTLEGTYEMTCELEADAEKCGEPLCDDLVLKGWGQVRRRWRREHLLWHFSAGYVLLTWCPCTKFLTCETTALTC